VKLNPLKILLIEDNIADADWIGEILVEENIAELDLKHVKRVKDALDTLCQDNFDAILLDLSLPDSQGIDSIAQVKKRAPESPIVVLTSLNDRDIAIQSVRQGAQDYLIKGRFEGELLFRSIRYAIERQRTEAALRQQAEREKLMGKMLERIRQSLDLKEILQTTVAEVRQFLQTDRVLIYRCQAEGLGEIVVESSDPDKSNSWNRQLSSALNFGQLNLSLSDWCPVCAIEDTYLRNVRALEEISRDSTFLAQHQIRAILTLPIWQSQSLNQHPNYCLLPTEEGEFNSEEPMTSNANYLWGVLVAHNYSTARKWQEWEIAFLQKLSTQVTLAIQQSELYAQLQNANQQLRQLAILDGLTGIANRRYFDRILNKEWKRLTREQQPLSLLLCDIDYFKDYNDTYGHPSGDHCLTEVAAVLKQATKRAADLVARYGGEEFAVILPNTNAKGALVVANAIRQKLHKLQLPHGKSAVSKYVTLSIGSATKIPNPNQNPSSLIKMADDALYRAKKAGRDRILQHKKSVVLNI
jgi:diguanylate cyclase (GGDEF)-like protein